MGLGNVISDNVYMALELDIGQGFDSGRLERQTSFGGHVLMGMHHANIIYYLRVGGTGTRYSLKAEDNGTRYSGRDWESAIAGGIGVMVPLFNFKPWTMRLEYIHKWYLDPGSTELTGDIEADEDMIRIGFTYHL